MGKLDINSAYHGSPRKETEETSLELGTGSGPAGRGPRREWVGIDKFSATPRSSARGAAGCCVRRPEGALPPGAARTALLSLSKRLSSALVLFIVDYSVWTSWGISSEARYVEGAPVELLLCSIAGYPVSTI